MKRVVLSILLGLALTAIGANLALATHTAVSQNAGAGRIIFELIDPTTIGNASPTVLSTVTRSTLNATLSCSGTSVIECPFGATVSFSAGGSTVTIGNKGTAIAKMVATPGSTVNKLQFINYSIINNSTTSAVAVRISGEFNFTDTSGAINNTASNGGRKHAFGCKANFYSCPSGTCPASPPVRNDRVICNAEFQYFDADSSSVLKEPIGGLAGVGVAIDYVVPSTNAVPTNTMANRCAEEGASNVTVATLCPDPTQILTKCPSSFGTCKAVENQQLVFRAKLDPTDRIEVGAGIGVVSGGAGCETPAHAASEGLLGCAVFQNQNLNADSGFVWINVFSGPNFDLATDCDLENATFGADGSNLGPPQQVQCGLDLNGDGFLDDCRLKFGPMNESGFTSGQGNATAQVTVSCDVSLSCTDGTQKGNNAKVIANHTGATVLDVPLVCSIDTVVE